MMQPAKLVLFGEALFDCFSAEEQRLGGAPFNVAWHLQAFGEAPLFISRVGEDALGQQIMTAMQQWQMRIDGVQVDSRHPTGTVAIQLAGAEPSYTIHNNVAYDFIEKAKLPSLSNGAIVYHGSLALRNPTSQAALDFLTQPTPVSVFVDVNLRAPWWDKKSVFLALERAKWAKLNEHELVALGFNSADIAQDMLRMQSHFQLEQLIVTRGQAGALVRSNDGKIYQQKPSQALTVKDTVGAGDAFTAMYLHGLIQGWPIQQSLVRAQQFASAVIGLQGAISEDKAFYQPHLY